MNKSIYFLIPDTPHLNDDSIVYLAEGLRELNINFSSNRDYWLMPENKFLFTKTDIDPREFDAIIISYKWTEHMDPFTFKTISNDLPKWLFDKGRKYQTVYLDSRDGYNTLSYTSKFRNFDFILRAKKNKFTKNYSNIYPWVLGFQNRILKEKIGISTSEKNYKIAVNFNYSHPYQHQLRKLAEECFISKLPTALIDRRVSPKEKPTDDYSLLMWENTVGLHNPKYYNHTENCLMVAAFCGELIPGKPYDPTPYMLGGKKAQIKKNMFGLLSTILRKKPRVIQWDSWRFWETLALGSVPIHIDLEKYGVELPIMPENWKHYIGIDLDDINFAIEKLIDDKETIYEIARNGEQWALENYSPKASAKHFLELLGN